MIESEPIPASEQEVKPVTIELKTKQEQEAMLGITYNALMDNTRLELRGAKVTEENKILLPMFKTLASNLGRQLGENEWLFLGIVDNIPLQTLEQWANPKDRPGMMTEYARHFVGQKRQAIQRKQAAQRPPQPSAGK